MSLSRCSTNAVTFLRLMSPRIKSKERSKSGKGKMLRFSCLSNQWNLTFTVFVKCFKESMTTLFLPYFRKEEEERQRREEEERERQRQEEERRRLEEEERLRREEEERRQAEDERLRVEQQKYVSLCVG